MAFDLDIPASFYERVGRIALEAAMLEEWLVELAVSLDISKGIADRRELPDPPGGTDADIPSEESAVPDENAKIAD